MGNHNSGRRPMPSALNELRGNPGKRKRELEPEPPTGEVEKPTWLSEGAARVWEELAPVCRHMGTLTSADVKPFSALCELQATFEVAAAAKSGKPLLELWAPKEGPMTVIVDAVLRLERETATTLRAYYDLFGLNPVSRAKIQVKKPEQPVSKWDGALKMLA